MSDTKPIPEVSRHPGMTCFLEACDCEFERIARLDREPLKVIDAWYCIYHDALSLIWSCYCSERVFVEVKVYGEEDDV